jgi:hypothetical protein
MVDLHLIRGRIAAAQAELKDALRELDEALAKDGPPVLGYMLPVVFPDLAPGEPEIEIPEGISSGPDPEPPPPRHGKFDLSDWDDPFADVDETPVVVVQERRVRVHTPPVPFRGEVRPDPAIDGEDVIPDLPADEPKTVEPKATEPAPARPTVRRTPRPLRPPAPEKLKSLIALTGELPPSVSHTRAPGRPIVQAADEADEIPF